MQIPYFTVHNKIKRAGRKAGKTTIKLLMEEFMTEKLVFECENCGKSLEASADDAKTLECCDKPMKQISGLDACSVSTTAEHSRFDNFDDACDDGRSGKI